MPMPAPDASNIALILYTLREFADSTEEAATTLKRVREMGYENIQVSAQLFISLDPGQMRQLADDAGLKIIGAHVNCDNMVENLQAEIDRIHTYGAAYMAIPSFHAENGTADEWKAFAGQCNEIGARLKEENIHLQYHNHAHEFEKLAVVDGQGGRTGFDILMAETDPNLLQSELDLAWVSRGAYDPVVILNQVAGRVDQVHAKDWGIVGGEPGWRAVGEGGLNWPAIIEACKHAGVKTYTVEQDNCPVTNDPFKSSAISFQNLSNMES